MLLPSSPFEVQGSRSAHGGINDSVHRARVHLLLRGTEDADVICPVLFPFPLLALYAGPEVRDSGRLRAGNRKFTDFS